MPSTFETSPHETDTDRPSVTPSSPWRSQDRSTSSSSGESSLTSVSSHSGAHNGIEGMTTQPGDDDDEPRRNLSRWMLDLDEIRSGSMTGMFNRQAMQTESAQNRKGDAAIRKVARLIKSGQAKKIVVLAGAGMSTSAGIPDFRSPKTGLYNNLEKFKLKTGSKKDDPDKLTLERAEDVFSLDFFKQNPEPFWTVAQEIYPGKHFPTPAHYFVNLLAQHQILEKIFTQNIDTLEQSTGLSPDLIVEAHGSFAMAHCLTCGKEASTEYVLRSGVRRGEVVRCARRGCNGLVKPDIVFFGEGLPDRFHNSLPSLPQCDLCIVIGTSLQVQPFANLLQYVRGHIPRILINRDPVGPFVNLERTRSRDDMISRFLAGVSMTDEESRPGDMFYRGDADEAVRKLAEELGWADELDELIESGNRELQKKWDARTDMEGPPAAAVELIDEPIARNPSTRQKKTRKSKAIVSSSDEDDAQALGKGQDPTKVPEDEIRDFQRLIIGDMDRRRG